MLETALIDKSFFKNIYSLPNLNGNDWVNEGAINDLNESILIFSTEYLENLLGQDLADLFIDAVNNNTLDTRFTDLKNKLIDETNCVSSITGYVFFNHARKNATTLTNAGEVAGSSNAAMVTNEGYKMNTAWNDMVKKTWKVIEWIEENGTTYPEFECNYSAFETINFFNI